MLYNKLTPKQMEQLFCLQEELGETIQAIGKVLRHGYEEYSPFDETKTTNRQNLERELGNASFWISELIKAQDLNPIAIKNSQENKSNSCKPYMHHQEEDSSEEVKNDLSENNVLKCTNELREKIKKEKTKLEEKRSNISDNIEEPGDVYDTIESRLDEVYRMAKKAGDIKTMLDTVIRMSEHENLKGKKW